MYGNALRCYIWCRRIAAMGAAVALFACTEKPAAPKDETQPVATPQAVMIAPARVAAPPPAPDADQELAARVRRALETDLGMAAAAGIEVTASNGVVRLLGTVGDDAAQRKAGSAASAVAGVTSVDNRLVIVRGS